MLGVLCTVYGLMAGLRSVQAFPMVDFVPNLVGLSPLAINLSVTLPLHTIVIFVMQLLKDNLVVTNKKNNTLTIWEVPTRRTLKYDKRSQKVSTAL